MAKNDKADDVGMRLDIEPERHYMEENVDLMYLIRLYVVSF